MGSANYRIWVEEYNFYYESENNQLDCPLLIPSTDAMSYTPKGHRGIVGLLHNFDYFNVVISYCCIGEKNVCPIEFNCDSPCV